MSSTLVKSSAETTASNPAATKMKKVTIKKTEGLVESSNDMSATNPSGDKLRDAVKDASNQESSKQVSDVTVAPATDEVAAAADTIKNEIQQSITQTAQQTQTRVKGSVQQIKSLFADKLSAAQGSMNGVVRQVEENAWAKKQIDTSRSFFNDLSNQSLGVKALFGAIFTTNCVLPLFFLNRIEGVVVFSTYVLVSILSHILYQKTASPDKFRSVALSHLLWVPMLFWLLSKSGTTDKLSKSTHMDHVLVSLTFLLKRSFFLSAWITSVLLVNSLALSVDALQMGQLYQEKTGASLGLPATPGAIVNEIENKAKSLVHDLSEKKKQFMTGSVSEQTPSENIAAPTA